MACVGSHRLRCWVMGFIDTTFHYFFHYSLQQGQQALTEIDPQSQPAGPATTRPLPSTEHFGLATIILQLLIPPLVNPPQSETSYYQCHPLLYKACYSDMASHSPYLEAQKLTPPPNESFTRRQYPTTSSSIPNHSQCQSRSYPLRYGCYN